MNLDRVTITGADDTTDPRKLIELSLEYPFVEWGFLFGAGVEPDTLWGDGNRRFPSHAWTEVLIELAMLRGVDLNLSLHLCGRYMRKALAGEDMIDNGEISRFIWEYAKRIQLNFHAVAQTADVDVVAKMANNSGKEWIFQLDGVNTEVFVNIAERTTFAVPLFDRSGGAGLLPDEWPKPIANAYCGYAGGIGPRNILDNLFKINRVAGSSRVWIDMETRVRSSNDTCLHMGRVADVLAICSSQMSQVDGTA